MLTTVLLGAAGVRHARLPTAATTPTSRPMLTTADHCLPGRLPCPGHSTHALRWPRRHRADLCRRRATVAFLQQEPRGLASTAQRDFRLQHRGGWPQGGLADAWMRTRARRGLRRGPCVMHLGRSAQRSNEAVSAIPCIAMLRFAAMPKTPLVPVTHARRAKTMPPSSAVFLKLPVSVVERADLARLEPS